MPKDQDLCVRMMSVLKVPTDWWPRCHFQLVRSHRWDSTICGSFFFCHLALKWVTYGMQMSFIKDWNKESHWRKLGICIWEDVYSSLIRNFFKPTLQNDWVATPSKCMPVLLLIEGLQLLRSKRINSPVLMWLLLSLAVLLSQMQEHNQPSDVQHL